MIKVFIFVNRSARIGSDLTADAVLFEYPRLSGRGLTGENILTKYSIDRYKKNTTMKKVKKLSTIFWILGIPLSFTVTATADNRNNPGAVTEEPAYSTIAEPITDVPAFPGAEGGGMYTTGGRGGRVLIVDKLTDDGSPGTLRWAIDQNYPRIIIFKVSGTITLTGNLEIEAGNVTLAGQSAPGDGICVRNFPTSIKGDNVIIRFMHFRLGDQGRYVNNKGERIPVQDDALGGHNHRNIIIDHCSMSWSTDECASFYDNTDFTLQWCILAESLNASVHTKGAHGYGGIWGGQNASFHHNLLACHNSRNPRMCGTRYTESDPDELVDFRNNVIFNWGMNSGYAGEGGRYNFVNNYYRPGPASGIPDRIFQPWPDDGTNKQPRGVYGTFYVAGNYMTNPDGTPNTIVNKDNWKGIHPSPSFVSIPGFGIAWIKSPAEYPMPVGHVTTYSAQTAFEQVTSYAGACRKRDAVDNRIIGYVATAGTVSFPYTGSRGSKNGLIDTPEDAGGYPVYRSPPYPEDNNGLPDAWAAAKKLDPAKASSVYGRDLDPNGQYTNLEVYLNELVRDIVDNQSKLR